MKKFMVEHRAFRLGDSIVLCATMQLHEKTPYFAVRRFMDHPAHACQKRDGYYVVYDGGLRIAEFQGKDL